MPRSLTVSQSEQSVSQLYNRLSHDRGVYCFGFASQIRYLSVRLNNPAMLAALMHSASGEDKRGDPKLVCEIIMVP